jgi:hypothetical protein
VAASFDQYDIIAQGRWLRRLEQQQCNQAPSQYWDWVGRRFAVDRYLEIAGTGTPGSIALDQISDALRRLVKRSEQYFPQPDWRAAVAASPAALTREEVAYYLSIWAAREANWIQSARVGATPLYTRLLAGIGVLDPLEPQWRQFAREDWCHRGHNLIEQVFMIGLAAREHIVVWTALKEIVGIHELDPGRQRLWLARHGLIALPGSAGAEPDDSQVLGRTWWKVIRPVLGSAPALCRTELAPVVARHLQGTP